MKLEKISLLIFCLAICFTSCKKDDNSIDPIVIELRDRDEVQAEDIALIEAYLSSHYYNSVAFDAITNASIKDLVITPLALDETEAPADHTLLINAVGESKKVVFADTDYEFYVLDLNPRIDENDGGKSPAFSDLARVRYEGFTLDNDVFDSAVTPVDFDLVNLIPGWRKVLPSFKTAESFMDGDDGTVDYMNHGVGVMFLPSGLAYFSNVTSGISAYEPIAFKFDLLQTAENDHDGDGIPSYLEDLNGDGEFTANFVDTTDETDDDTDGDTIPNYFDADDDGDGIPTIDEDIDGDGDPTNDIGKNNIPKYLDPEETESN